MLVTPVCYFAATQWCTYLIIQIIQLTLINPPIKNKTDWTSNLKKKIIFVTKHVNHGVINKGVSIKFEVGSQFE